MPDAMSKELAKKPQKFFSKSTVVFKNEVITTSGPSKTREEVREDAGEYLVGKTFDDGSEENNGAGNAGVGYGSVGNGYVD